VNADGFDRLIVRQTELIAALDAGDPDAILAASAAMADAVEAVRGGQAPRLGHLDHGLKLADAARIRVNYLTAWNRQKIDRLAHLRGQSTDTVYAKPRFYGA
jgi:hypothetical protein